MRKQVKEWWRRLSREERITLLAPELEKHPDAGLDLSDPDIVDVLKYFIYREVYGLNHAEALKQIIC